MERLRLVENPVDRLARTVEALLVIASKPLSIEELATVTEEGRSGSRPRSASSRGASARDGAASCWSTLPADMPSGPRARRRRPARGSSSVRFSAASRRRRSRRSRSSPTSGRCRDPRSPASAGVAADSAVAGLVERGLIAEAGREREGGAVRYETTPLFERVFGLADRSELPELDELGGDVDELRSRLEDVARRPAEAS